MKKHWITLSLVGLVIVGAVVAAFFLSSPQGDTLPASVRMTAAQQTDKGVAPASAFTITTDYRVTEEELRAMLSCEPDIGTYILTGSGRTWSLTPAAPLAKNSVYTFGIKNSAGGVVQSFAFQTESDLLINTVFPANEERRVAPDAGIEITFNTTGVLARDYFEIKPEIAGTFETKEYTFIFKPDAPLPAGNIYRVSIKAGLTAPNGTVLAEDYKFSFETVDEDAKDEYRRLALAGDYSETFLTGDPLAIQLAGGQETTDLKFDVKLNKYANINDYINELKAHDAFYKERYGRKTDYAADTAGLEEVVSFNAALYRQSEQWAGLYAVLPQDLPEGHYIATVSGKDSEGKDQFVQKLIQIRNFSVYTQSVDGDTLLWLNDAVAGEPLSDRLLYITDSDAPDTPIEVFTQEDGTARLMTGKTEDAYLSVMESGKVTYFERLKLGAQDEVPLEERYYSAVYTDREIYQPTDKIRFWGVLKPRHATSPMPATVTASIGDTYDRYNKTYLTPLYREKLTVKPDGTFEGEFSISGLEASYYSLCVGDGDKGTYLSKSIEVSAYTKPAFVVTATTDKEFYYIDEPITLKVDAKYFDGTPVGNGKLGLNTGPSDLPENPTIALDAAGQGSITFKYQENESYRGYISGWQPQGLWYELTNANSADAYFSTNGTIRILPSRVAARFESEEADAFTFYTAALDDSKLDSPPAAVPLGSKPVFDYEFERLKGASLDIPVTFTVHKVAYVKKPVSSYYDYLNKKTITRYKYDRIESVAQTIQSKTAGGKVTISGLPYKNTDEVTYWLEASFDGGVNGKISTAFYYSDRFEYFQGKDTGGATYAFNSSGFGEWSPPAKASLGEKITLGLYRNGEKIENKGKVLVAASQRRTLEVGYFNGNELSVEMNEEYLPNIRFTGAYFDGRHIFRLEEHEVAYRYDEKKLNIDVKTDKESYKPGEKATVTIAVTDQSGKPAAGTACIGVVDEAVFTLRPQEVDFIGQLYQRIYYPQIQQKASYVEYNLEAAVADMGGKGGGGDNGAPLREEFVDTALFQSVAVGADGKATAVLTLPDNITSWRVTAVAVTPELLAGDNLKNTVATLPFYVQPLFTESYLVGDDVAVGLGGSGTAVKTGDPADYRVAVLDAAGRELVFKETSGKVGASVFVNFGKLGAGQYELLVDGKSGGNADAMKQPFAVIEEGLSVPVFRNMALNELAGLKSARFPVGVTVYDERLQPYMTALSALSMGGAGDRTERLAASYRARIIANELLEEADRAVIPRDDRLDTIQKYEDGVAALPFASGDAAVTAKMLLVAPELVRTADATAFLQKVLTNAASTPDDRVMAYVGLAALKKPVLLDITRMAAEPSLTVSQRLYAGAGMAALGDYSGAQAIYDSLGKMIVTEGNLKYIDQGGTADERQRDTAAALMLTSLAAHPDASAIIRYFNGLDVVRAKSGVDSSLEILAYLTHFTAPQGGNAGRFSVTLDGKAQEIELGAAGYKPLKLSAEGLAAANLKALSGKVYAGVSYTDYASRVTDEAGGGKLKAEKTYKPVEDVLKVGGRVLVSVKVTFDPAAPSGCYTISDYIPAGMRYVTVQEDYRLNPRNSWLWSSMTQEAQTVRGVIYRDKDALESYWDDENVERKRGAADAVDGEGNKIDINTCIFQYYVSVALPGEFITEGVHVSFDAQGIAVNGARGKLTAAG